MLHRYSIFLGCGRVDCCLTGNSFFELLCVVEKSMKVGYWIALKYGLIGDASERDGIFWNQHILDKGRVKGRERFRELLDSILLRSRPVWSRVRE